jgi:hypothetical protein
MTPRTSFYTFTRNFSERVGNVGSFIWASYAGLWHLRERALEFGKVSSHPEWQRVSDHLIGSAPSAAGVDLQPLVKLPWSSAETSFSDLILTQGASSYEEWCVDLAQMTAAAGKKVKAETFQFPAGARSPRWTNWAELDVSGVLSVSSFLDTQIKPGLIAAFAANVNNLDALLMWYRHFKEIRNTVAHHGGLARLENEVAFNAAMKVPLTSIGLRRDYLGVRPVAGTRISLSVADATLFFAVIQRLALAFDAKFCHTLAAEAHLAGRVRTALANARPPGAAPQAKKLQWIRGFLSRGVHIHPASLDEAEKWLRAANLVSIRTQLI